jgi:hypothetical protein
MEKMLDPKRKLVKGNLRNLRCLDDMGGRYKLNSLGSVLDRQYAVSANFPLFDIPINNQQLTIATPGGGRAIRQPPTTRPPE